MFLTENQVISLLMTKYGLSLENSAFIADYAKETGSADWKGYNFQVVWNKNLGRYKIL
jgi:hypothetical protein